MPGDRRKNRLYHNVVGQPKALSPLVFLCSDSGKSGNSVASRWRKESEIGSVPGCLRAAAVNVGVAASPARRPGGERKKVMLEMIRAAPNPAGQLSLPLGPARRNCTRQMCRTTRPERPRCTSGLLDSGVSDSRISPLRLKRGRPPADE